MPEFLARVGWPDGRVGEETVISASPAAARAEFERRGGHVFEIRERGGLLALPSGRRHRLRAGQFMIFNQELIALLKAGLPILRAIELLLERRQDRQWREVLSDVRDRITSGSSLSDAIAAHGTLFPRLYATSIRAGEKAGELVPVLRRFLKYQKTIVALRRKVVSTLTYPAILVVVSISLIAILMTVVIPRFTEFFTEFGTQLPLLTRVVIGVAGAVHRNIWFVLAAAAAGGFLLRRWAATPQGREALEAQALHLPFVGGIFRRFSIAQFTRSLATLLSGGTPLVPALENAADAVGNSYVAARLAGIVPKVREGGELWRALDDTQLMTSLTVEMVKVGESSGTLEEMLNEVSEFYDEEIDHLLARVVSFAEPAVLVFMGIIIATILMAVYLPLFTILSTMRG